MTYVDLCGHTIIQNMDIELVRKQIICSISEMGLTFSSYIAISAECWSAKTAKANGWQKTKNVSNILSIAVVSDVHNMSKAKTIVEKQLKEVKLCTQYNFIARKCGKLETL